MARQIVVIDCETRSHADIKEVGAWEYSAHPTTQILCIAWAVAGSREDLKKAKIKSHNYLTHGPSDELETLLKDENTIVCAHNFFFEYSILKNVRGIDINPSRAICTAARAAALALPRHLEGACLALNLPIKKDMEGKRLMLKMCKPRRETKNNKAEWHETPKDLARLIQYCETDVGAEVLLLLNTPPLHPNEKLVWELDQKINARGVRIDRELVNVSLNLIDEETEKLRQETLKLTDGKIESLTRRDAMLKFINSLGENLPDLTAKTVSDSLNGGLVTNLTARRLLEIRQSISKTSTAKYAAFEARSRSDGRVRDLLVYHGASTGRWSGSGVQVQNLFKSKFKYSDIELIIKIIKGGNL